MQKIESEQSVQDRKWSVSFFFARAVLQSNNKNYIFLWLSVMDQY